MPNKTIIQIKSLGNIITGKTPKTNITEYWNGDIPFITPTDIPDYSTKHLFHVENYISNLGYEKQKKTLLPKGTICVSCIATIGKVCQLLKPSITNQQINSIVLNKNYDSDFIFYLFRFDLKVLTTIGGGTGSGTPIINKNKFGRIKIEIFCDLEYQKKVGQTLSKYDQLIEINNKKIALLEEQAKELYKEWFVRFRFPGYEKTKFINGIPEGWKIKKLGDAFTPFIRGKNITSEEMVEGEIPVISAGLSPSGFHNKSNVNLPSITMSGSGANAGYLKFNYEPIWAADCSYYDNSNDVFYLYCLLSTNQKIITNLQHGTGQPHVYPKDLARLKFLIPTRELITESNLIYMKIFKQINGLKFDNLSQ